MSFVLDTNIVSEACKGSRAYVGISRWFSSIAAEDLYLSVLVAGEIRQSIEGLRRRDQIQTDHLGVWISGLRRRYADRILPMDLEIAEEWGCTNAPDHISSRDGLMAATSKVRNITLVTRNTADVARTGVHLLNLFDHSS